MAVCLSVKKGVSYGAAPSGYKVEHILYDTTQSSSTVVVVVSQKKKPVGVSRTKVALTDLAQFLVF